LAAAEAEAADALSTAGRVQRELKRARQAASSGQVRDLRRALTSAGQIADELRAAVATVRDSYHLDETSELASGAYAKELLAAAAEAGVAMFEEDDQLLCYPSIVRVLPGDQAIEIDRKRVRGLRPSAVVARLERAQRAGAKFKSTPFLASLAKAYDLVCAGQGKAPGSVVRLLDVYNVLTLLPGQTREYTKPEFARDLYLLDQSQHTEHGGRRLRWAASSGTRQSGVLSTVAKSGQQQRYWGIAFEPMSRDERERPA
jgi:hypothetical protein